MMQDGNIRTIISLIEKDIKKKELPIVTKLAEENRDPFKVLISTLLSLRTKDEVTSVATEKLFALATTPAEMEKLKEQEIQKAIYPVGFYRNKAETIINVCRILINRFDSHVPENIEDLLTIRGVGRKTANLVVSLGYNRPGICVDTHVHRISNRLGYVRTKTPEETEFALREKLPAEYWIKYNTLMVSFGKNTCRPVSPLCSLCPVLKYCKRVGVTKSR
jgi:endonuclease III